MAKVNVLTMEGKDAGTMELKDEIFGIEPNQNAVLEMVKNHLANKRQGTQSAKDRGEVRGSTRKPFRQKGTGRHRQGDRRDPSQIGGGVVFAPKPRSYRYKVPRSVRRLAMLSALSSKVQENEMIILDEINYAVKYELITEKDMLELLDLRPKELHLVMTGRDAADSLVERADLVTEMKEIKHPYQKGIKAQKGIEF